MKIEPGWLLRRMRRLPPAQALHIGFSGGLDSHVLLHLMSSLREQLPPIRAIHVHHGLQDQADAWTEHCRSVCDELDIPLAICHVDARPREGEGPEAAARHARYRAYASVMGQGESLLTAHHQDDQAETLLLQLFRGAGPAGLAAMPAWSPFAEGWHGRPLLEASRDELEDYAREQSLNWVEDPSNKDLRYRRNFIRQQLMPQLREYWPQITKTLAADARLQAESLGLGDTLARLDEEEVRGEVPATLSVSHLKRLTWVRQKNLIRYWLKQKGLPMPGQGSIGEIRKVLDARDDACARVSWKGGELHRYRDALYAFAPLPEHDPAIEISWPAGEDISNPATGEMLFWQTLLDMGVRLEKPGQPLTLRFRRGGERIKPGADRPHRKLKLLMQEAGIPPWERDRIPLVYEGARLLAVYDYWVNND
jgi:tRNA(Ile)-lysidine synthase